jgi:hypothetical protein
VKQLSLALFLSAAAALRLAAQDGSLAGKWKIHSVIGGNEGNMDCAFALKGSELTGTCGEGTQVKGKVEGKNITWQRNVEYSGQSLTLVYTGKADSDKIAGTVEVQGMGAGGEFTATRVK